jgi:hypothetical protein
MADAVRTVAQVLVFVALTGCNAIYGIDDLTTVDPSSVTGGVGSGTSTGPSADDCTLDGVTVPNGQSHTFFSTPVHLDCPSVAKERHCVDGVLDGDASYGYASCGPPVDFPGGDQTAESVLEFARYLSLHLETQSPLQGGALSLHGENVGGYDYLIKEGDQTISSFDSGQWFTNAQDDRSAWVIVRGNLTIESNQMLRPDSRKLFTVVYATGSCTVDGSISMSQRGANHSSSGSNISAAAIRIASGTFSGVVDPQVPAAGAAGGPGNSSGDGNAGSDGVDGATGGGASGAGATGGGGGGDGRSGDGAQGSSFSGGAASGAGAKAGNSAQDATSDAAASNGGAGSDGVTNSGVTANRAAGGGAGNPGGNGENVSGSADAGEDGTGGVLVIICEGDFSGSGSITANGANGGDASASGTDGTAAAGGGGGSGGGSITMLIGGSDSGPAPQALGGSGGTSNSSGASADGGRGGNGTARKLAL